LLEVGVAFLEVSIDGGLGIVGSVFVIESFMDELGGGGEAGPGRLPALAC
jgi:hypothetical protein